MASAEMWHLDSDATAEEVNLDHHVYVFDSDGDIEEGTS